MSDPISDSYTRQAPDLIIPANAGGQAIDTGKTPNYEKPSSAYTKLRQLWDLIDDLMGGTLTMRNAGTVWLPMETKEEHDRYQIRLSRSILFEALKDTVSRLADKPFKKPVSFEGELPAKLKFLEKRVDRSGTSLTKFAGNGFTHGEKYGSVYIFVDMPKIADAKNVNVAEAEQEALTPYFTLLHPRTVVSKIYGPDEYGRERLTRVRMVYESLVENSNFEEEKVKCVKIVWLDSSDPAHVVVRWKILEKKNQATSYSETSSGDMDIDEIPLVEVPFTDEDTHWPEPPLIGLAWLNLRHWQSGSDQANILRIARTGMLLLRGLSTDDMKKDIVFGPNYVFKTTNDKAEGKFIEYAGTSIEAGERDLKDTETRMELFGLTPLIRNTARVAATSRSIDEGKSESKAESWARKLGEGLTRAVQIAAKWTNSVLPDDFKVKIFSSFGISLFNQAELTALETAVARGGLTDTTFLRELQRRAVLDEDLNIEQEVKSLPPKQPGQPGGPIEQPTLPFGNKPNPKKKKTPPVKPAEGGNVAK